jgi:ABC-type branched-subunit amino acid transport system permease subunit
MFGGRFALPSPRPRLGGLHTDTDVGYYHVALIVAVACCAAVVLIRRSRMGRLLRAFADSPTAVDAHGTNTNELKVLVFCASAFLAGIAGALIAPVTGTASAISFDFSVSLLLVAVLFVAGRQPILSAVLGAVLYVVVPGYITGVNTQEWTPVVFGGVAVLAAMFGGVPLLERLRSWRPRRPPAVDHVPAEARAAVLEEARS